MTPDAGGGADDIVRVGMQRVARAPERLRALGVGSCIVVALWDAEVRQGGLAHIPLPRREDRIEPPEQFVDSGVRRLVETLAERGSGASRLEAKAAGGASLLRGYEPSRAASIAALNIDALEEVLKRLDVPLVAQDLGGSAARSVELDTETGELRVTSLPDTFRVL